jgi:hypothetical protein
MMVPQLLPVMARLVGGGVDSHDDHPLAVTTDLAAR